MVISLICADKLDDYAMQVLGFVSKLRDKIQLGVIPCLQGLWGLGDEKLIKFKLTAVVTRLIGKKLNVNHFVVLQEFTVYYESTTKNARGLACKALKLIRTWVVNILYNYTHYASPSHSGLHTFVNLLKLRYANCWICIYQSYSPSKFDLILHVWSSIASSVMLVSKWNFAYLWTNHLQFW